MGINGGGESMRLHLRRKKPETWAERREAHVPGWAVPFSWLEHKMEWLAYLLSNWTFLEVLEYLGSFGVLVAVIFYFGETGDRLKQKHYQAWQVIDLAQGKGGNGGRIEALEELNADGVSLVGVNLSEAFLVRIRLPKADLARANFDAADARQAEMRGAIVRDASLRSANFRGANLEGASFERSQLDEADLSGAKLNGADFAGASLENADLGNAELKDVKWEALRSAKGANVYGVKDAPAGFVAWAKAHGAVEVKGNINP